jgi:hypothetical protein
MKDYNYKKKIKKQLRKHEDREGLSFKTIRDVKKMSFWYQ